MGLTPVQGGVESGQERKVLIAEDDVTISRGLELNLVNEGYEVLKATSGKACIDQALRLRPDLIILDLMLPDMSGLDVCRTLRQSRLDAIIIMLTVKGHEMDRVVGLEVGADDYMSKPFSLRELLARIRAHLRRRPAGEADSLGSVQFGAVELDFDKFSAKRDGKDVVLTTKEFDLLRLLLQHRGQVLSRERILELVWGYQSMPTTRTVDNHILHLRQKLEDDPARPKHILSVWGEGYRFAA